MDSEKHINPWIYLLAVLVLSGLFSSLIVILYATIHHTIFDNLLVLLILPAFYAAFKFDTRIYLPSATIIICIVVLALEKTSRPNHLYDSIITALSFLGCALFFCEIIFQNMRYRRRILQEKQELIKELEQSLSEVKTLQRLLPICSSCKKIRDDQGYWQQLESYFHHHSDMEFTHSFCPDCIQKLYPEYTDESGD